MELFNEVLAYRAMFVFLDRYFDLTKSEDIGQLLSSMSMLNDGLPVDPAIWEDWKDAIGIAIKNQQSADLKLNP